MVASVRCDWNRCDLCKNFLFQTSKLQSSATVRRYPIWQKLACSSKNVIFPSTCCKCSLQVVGSTSTEFKIRFHNHKIMKYAQQQKDMWIGST